MRRLLLALPVFLSCVTALSLGAQEPPRPALPSSVDANDWESYYDFAVERVNDRRAGAYEGFYWASRLDPSRAEPLIGLWVGFWLKDQRRWQRYLRDDRTVREADDVLAMRRTRYEALLRNPMTYQGLTVVLWDILPGRWRDDIEVRAAAAYASADLPRAIDLYGRAIARKPQTNLYLRWERATAFVALGQTDSAVAELNRLLDALRASDERQLVDVYESKAMIEYAIGRLYLDRNQVDRAREAFERAIVEDITFHPAHAMIGLISARRRQREAAVANLEQALQFAGDDPWVSHMYAGALSGARRDEEAVEQLRRVLELEPWWAEPRLALANALDRLGRGDEALAAFESYVAIAPRRAAADIQRARGRMAALRSSAQQ
jgi:tetratricopeptide (TPR) repeat protein